MPGSSARASDASLGSQVWVEQASAVECSSSSAAAAGAAGSAELQSASGRAAGARDENKQTFTSVPFSKVKPFMSYIYKPEPARLISDLSEPVGDSSKYTLPGSVFIENRDRVEQACHRILGNPDPGNALGEFEKLQEELLAWSHAPSDYFSESPVRADRLEYMTRNAIKSLVLYCCLNRSKSLSLSGLYPTSLPRSFQFLAPHVKILKLDEHGFEKWPRAINDLKYLEELSMSGGKLADLTDMGNFQNLRVLCLARNKLKDLKGLNAPALEELDVYGNRLGSLDGLPALSKLRKLSVNVNSFPKMSFVTGCLTQSMFPSLNKETVINGDLKKEIQRRGSKISRLLNIWEERERHAQLFRADNHWQKTDIEEEKSQDLPDKFRNKSELEFSLNAEFKQPDWICEGPSVAKSLYQSLKSWVDEKNNWDWEYCPRIEASSRILNCSRGQWKELNLSDLYLTSLPDAFQPLAEHLLALHFHNHRFEIWPEEINVLKKLKVLTGSNGWLTSLAGIETFPELEVLVLHHNRLLSLKDFPSQPKMKELWVNHNKLLNLAGLPPLPMLKKLEIDWNPFSKGESITRFLLIDNFPELGMYKIHSLVKGIDQSRLERARVEKSWGDQASKAEASSAAAAAARDQTDVLAEEEEEGPDVEELDSDFDSTKASSAAEAAAKHNESEETDTFPGCMPDLSDSDDSCAIM